MDKKVFIRLFNFNVNTEIETLIGDGELHHYPTRTEETGEIAFAGAGFNECRVCEKMFPVPKDGYYIISFAKGEAFPVCKKCGNGVLSQIEVINEI